MRARSLRVAGVAAVATVLLAGCATSSTASEESSDGLTHISFALSYLADPALNGLAYANEHGLFEEAGIALDIVPWGSTPSEQLVSSGQAEFGFSTDVRIALLAMASGADLVSYMTTYEHTPYDMTVLADSEFNSPKDLAGQIYGGFGSPMEVAVINDMIKADGGTEDAENVTLSSAAYDALAAGRVATILGFPGDNYAIEKGGNEIRTFDTRDYGVPDSYSGLLISSSAYVEENPEIAESFISALQEGYKAAVADPDAANADLMTMFPDELDPEVVEFVSDIQEEELYVSPNGVFGSQTAEIWQLNADWLIEQGLMVDESGTVLTEYDASSAFDDSFLTP